MPGLYELRALLKENEPEIEAPVPQTTASDHKNDKFNVVSTMAYLLGVSERIFDNPHEAPQRSIYDDLDKQKPARIIRNLCRLRNALQQRYLTINNQMMRDTKGWPAFRKYPRMRCGSSLMMESQSSRGIGIPVMSTSPTSTDSFRTVSTTAKTFSRFG